MFAPTQRSPRLTQKLLITVYLQNLLDHSCFPCCRLPFNWLHPSGMIDHQWILFSPKKKLHTRTVSVIFTRGNAWLLCLIRDTFQHAIGYQSGSLRKKQYPCAWETNSSYDLHSFPVAQGGKQSWSAPWVSQARCRQLFLLLSCYEELPLDWLLFIIGNSPSPQAPFPLFPFCAVPGLFVLRSFFLHFRGLTLQAAFCGRQEGQREGETGVFLPLPLSGSSSGNLHGPSPGQTPATPTGTGWPWLSLQ